MGVLQTTKPGRKVLTDLFCSSDRATIRRLQDCLNKAHRFLMGTTDRTTIRLSDERRRLLEQAEEIVASSPTDEPPVSEVIDAVLTHLIESHECMDELRGEVPPATIKQFNTSVIGLHYRTDIESRWR